MEKIINNYDVLQLIFHYLDFEEHLKLIKICPQFEYAVVHGVWRSRYKNLRLSPLMYPDGFGFFQLYSTEDKVMSECPLTSEEIHEILHHSSIHIHKLELNNIDCLENIISFNYHNLTELSLRYFVVEDTDLQQVAENCLNLQSLILSDITRNSDYKPNIRANVFGKMKALNELEIYDMNFTAWSYFDVQQLFCIAHLKTLFISISIGDKNANEGNNNTSTDRVYNIEDLTIGALPYLQSGNICFIEDLIRFENLTKLSITLAGKRDSITDKVLTEINNACPKLCGLSFSDCYLTFNEFPRMNNLKHLTFNSCKNIKFKNFDEIFRKLKLKSLNLVGAPMRYEEEFDNDYNYISNTLETLLMEYIDSRTIIEVFFNGQHKFENVSTVRLSENDFSSSESTALCFSHNFPYLQELIMHSFHISSKDILHLKHLKVLQFHLIYDMSWSYLEILFKHPTLTHITIMCLGYPNFGEIYERFPNSCEGLTTILEYLSLPSMVYKSSLSFWPSFRQRNKLLKLEIVDFDT